VFITCSSCAYKVRTHFSAEMISFYFLKLSCIFSIQEPVIVEYFESFSHPETHFMLSSDVLLDFVFDETNKCLCGGVATLSRTHPYNQ